MQPKVNARKQNQSRTREQEKNTTDNLGEK